MNSKRGWKDRFSSKRSAKWFQNRVVPVGGKDFPYKQQLDEDMQVTFCTNNIKSSKYNILTFWFINPYEQFRRVANFYFLIVAIVQLSLPEPPVSPFTSVAPLVFVVITTMIKQGYEDFCRHKSDNAINKAPVNILKEGKVVTAMSEDIQVGDIVKVKKGEQFPSDLVLISTSLPNGKCFVMTANLDGETNLKPLSASKETRDCTTPELLANLQAQIECQNPSPDLHSFNGRLKVKKINELIPGSLGLDNIALRGTQLRNTDHVYGCAVYTGRDTKMSQNSKLGANKFSTVEKTMNKILLVYIGILLFEIILCTSLKYSFGVLHDYQTFEDIPAAHWYLGPYIQIKPVLVLQEFFSFLVIFNNIVPISLYVTLEVQKFVGSLFLVWDRDLYDPETDEPAKCNSSDLNEELGQIEILFSDKTGTLTENIMIFKEASIAGIQHDADALKKINATFSSFTNDSNTNREANNSGQEQILQNPQEEIQISEFLSALSVCHTVQVAAEESENGINGFDNKGYVPDNDNEHLEYNASSPDEKALVEACAMFGMKFIGEEEDEQGIQCKIIDSRSGESVLKLYTKLHVLEFDSTRKRMSVIVRYPCGKIMLVTKGAETSVLPMCIEGPIRESNKHIDEYALVGLRTLAVAVKEMSSNDLENFESEFNAAQQAIEGRDEKIRQVYEMIERDYVLLGATAVEDKLQDGVKDTLVNLGIAGISVWILTGDKKETAINISYSCGHLQPGMTVLDVTGQTNMTITNKLQGYADQMNFMEERFGLIVDGASLTLIMPVEENRELLYQVASKCRAVVCCRMSPLQKSEIVRMMKNSPLKPVTAAIGDGGNDVAMIQEAHVGLGIMGKEGRAAVRSSDFAFSKFKFLQKVVLVHGHWYYYRVAMLVQYFFYKNVAGFGGQLFYAFYNNFSMQTLYDSFNLTFYNIFWTSLPIFLYALLEQNLDSKTLLNNPVFYRRIAKNYLLSYREFFLWFLYGLWHAVAIFFGWVLFWSYTSNGSGLPLNVQSDEVLGQFSFGVCIYSTVIALVNLKLLFQSRSWNAQLILGIVVSVAGYVALTFAYDALRINVGIFNFFGGDYNSTIMPTFPVDPDRVRVYFHVLASPGVWLNTLLVLVVALLPDVVIRVFRKHWAVIIKESKLIKKRLQTKMNRGSYELNGLSNPGFDEHDNGIRGGKMHNMTYQPNANV
eukprot:GFUD01006485.1.p1 GENE.GFUD01006485.1~~GFUD01006485.1.p1  ORF type:complete len:1188 (+),score=195.19 GFUD01006485.1:192-3755(+)